MTDEHAGSVSELDLRAAVAEVERHVAADGWDQRPRLFALADTASLVAREPDLADRLGLLAPDTSVLTPIEQEQLPDGELDQALAHVGWGPEVIGCALVHEVLVLPPEAEADLGEHVDPVAAAADPRRREVRLAVAVLRAGPSACVARVRPAGPDDPDQPLVTGPLLAPGLVAALRATLD